MDDGEEDGRSGGGNLQCIYIYNYIYKFGWAQKSPQKTRLIWAQKKSPTETIFGARKDPRGSEMSRTH